MLGHDFFYFDLVRKYIALFGTLFNDVYIDRYDSSNNVIKHIRVPITYSPKDKMLARVSTDPLIDRQTALVSPRISYEMTGMNYSPSRHIAKTQKVVVRINDSDSNMKRQYTPVPYDMTFNLYIYAKNAKDSTKILEQILPFFTPSWTPTVELISEMEEVKDIPIVLNSVMSEDNYEDAIENRRSIVWTLTFTMQGWFYGPVVRTGIIKFANVTFYIPNTANIRSSVGTIPGVERITVQPGLDANGNPTSNLELTIPYADINEADDWTYIINTIQLQGNNA
jgi:hypothetical protein